MNSRVIHPDHFLWRLLRIVDTVESRGAITRYVQTDKWRKEGPDNCTGRGGSEYTWKSRAVSQEAFGLPSYDLVKCPGFRMK